MKELTYFEWILPMRQRQISIVALLTACLYLIFSVIETYIASPKELPFLRFFHLYTIPVSLIGISYLAYTKRYPKALFIILMIAPIYTNTGVFFIMYNHPGMSIVYFGEVFLSIFWIFTISGLNLKKSIITATIVVVMTLIYLYIFNPYSRIENIVSIFWVFASFYFGLIGAILLNSYSEKMYYSFIDLQTISKTDKLTGLYNRTFIDQDFKMKLHFTQKNNIIISMIMIDIDNFKEINDTHGHHVGDSTLVQIAQVMKKYSDKNNIIIRWGGEEFLIIKIDTDEEKVKELCENIRQDVDKQKFQVVENVSISLGYSLCKKLDTFELILNRADSALYTAKRNGKNRVESLL